MRRGIGEIVGRGGGDGGDGGDALVRFLVFGGEVEG